MYWPRPIWGKVSLVTRLLPPKRLFILKELKAAVGAVWLLGQGQCPLFGVERCPLLGGSKCTIYMVRSIGGTGFVHCTEVVRFSEGPLLEFSLYMYSCGD